MAGVANERLNFCPTVQDHTAPTRRRR
jgi:hypothetical protein